MLMKDNVRCVDNREDIKGRSNRAMQNGAEKVGNENVALKLKTTRSRTKVGVPCHYSVFDTVITGMSLGAY